MTGKHPIQIGLQRGVIMPAQPSGLGLKEKLLPEYLNTLGYKSHMVGKWHLGMCAEEYTPMHRGFESHFGFYQGCESYTTHMCGNSGLDFWLNEEPDHSAGGQYSTSLFTAKAEQLLAEHDTASPMFLYLAHQAVHVGNQDQKFYAPDKYTDKLSFISDDRRRQMAGMLTALDESVGKVTKALHAKGMLENTIIVFSSDNGAPHIGNSDHTVGSNFPLRGGKPSIWEGGSRVPAFVWSPLFKKSGYISKQLMHISDWLPTLLQAAGYDTSALPTNLYGVSQWQTLQENGPSPRDSVLYNVIAGCKDKSWALRVGDMKLLRAQGKSKKNAGWYQPFSSDILSQPKSRDPAIISVVPAELLQSQVTPILRELGRGEKSSSTEHRIDCGAPPVGVVYNCIGMDKPCLFNITADPCEYHNLANDMPEIVKMLEARLETLVKMSVTPINKPDDPAANPDKHGGVLMPWIQLAEDDL